MKDENSKKTRKNWLVKGKIRRIHDNFKNAHCMLCLSCWPSADLLQKSMQVGHSITRSLY